jgi:Domain of unknown function (DUF6457)
VGDARLRPGHLRQEHLRKDTGGIDMEWVDRLAAELSLDHLSPHEKEHLLSASREVAHRVERKATPLAMYVLGLSVGSQMADRKRDDSIEDAIHALLLRLPDPEDA